MLNFPKNQYFHRQERKLFKMGDDVIQSEEDYGDLDKDFVDELGDNFADRFGDLGGPESMGKMKLLQERLKAALASKNPEELARLSEELKSTFQKQTPTLVPTYHEYLLFFVVVAFIIIIFGKLQNNFFFVCTRYCYMKCSQLQSTSNNKKFELFIEIYLNKLFFHFLFHKIAFFGYKLYKSLTERQRKREEKQRAKNSRKKK